MGLYVVGVRSEPASNGRDCRASSTRARRLRSPRLFNESKSGRNVGSDSAHPSELTHDGKPRALCRRDVRGRVLRPFDLDAEETTGWHDNTYNISGAVTEARLHLSVIHVVDPCEATRRSDRLADPFLDRQLEFLAHLDLGPVHHWRSAPWTDLLVRAICTTVDARDHNVARNRMTAASCAAVHVSPSPRT